MDMKLRIIARAVNIRMKKGEKLEDILASYPKLTDAEKEQIREVIQ